MLPIQQDARQGVAVNDRHAVTSLAILRFVGLTFSSTPRYFGPIHNCDFSKYRNQLIHLFTEDGLVYMAFNAVAQMEGDLRVASLRKVTEYTCFLRRLCEGEFVFWPTNSDEEAWVAAERMVAHARHQGVLFSRQANRPHLGVAEFSSSASSSSSSSSNSSLLDETIPSAFVDGQEELWSRTESKETVPVHSLLHSLMSPFLENYWYIHRI